MTCLFKYKISCVNYEQEGLTTVAGLVVADDVNDYAGAIKKLQEYYDNIESIRHLEPITDLDVIECCEDICNEIQDNWVW